MESEYGGGVEECFRISGLLKIVECLAIFTCLMLHRIGDRTYQVFFGASDLILHSDDVTYPVEADAEILGAGVVMAFAVITPMILLAYAVEGRKKVQGTYLDAMFCFVGAATLIAAGGKYQLKPCCHMAPRHLFTMTRDVQDASVRFVDE